MGDIQSEESRDIVVELELPSMPSDIALEQVPLVKAELTYFNVITSQLDNTQCLLTTNRIGMTLIKLYPNNRISYCSALTNSWATGKE